MPKISRKLAKCAYWFIWVPIMLICIIIEFPFKWHWITGFTIGLLSSVIFNFVILESKYVE